VLDLTSEFSENKAFLGLDYKDLPVLDLTELSVTQLREAAEFMAQRSVQGVVYVHCKAGYSRSAAAVGAYLLATNKAKSVEECFAIMRNARPAIIFRPEVSVALNKFLGYGPGNYQSAALNSISASVRVTAATHC
jgi:protein phosphatase